MTPIFFAEIFRDYLADPASATAGVPSARTTEHPGYVAFQCISDPELKAAPRVFINCAPDPEGKHPKKTVFLIELGLTVELSDSARQQAETWMRAIRARLLNRIAFGTWINEHRTDEQRTDWSIRKLRLFQADEGFSADGDTDTYILSVPARLTVHYD